MSNMTHWLAIVIFIVLWRFHRVMGKLILDKNGAGKVAPSSSTLSAPISKTLDSPSMTKRSCFFYQEAADVPSEDDIWLQNQAPDATCAERKRFYLARNGNREATAKALETYLNWRRSYSVPETELFLSPSTNDKNQDEWRIATALALRLHGERCDKILPQFVNVYQDENDSAICDDNGARLFHVTPGQIDERICKTSIYATALAIYLDRRLSRDDTELISVVIDVRGGRGWRNLNAASQLPFIQSTATLLLTMFPERLARAIIFPIPAGFVWLWTIASRVIDEKTRSKIGLLSGTATIDSPLPLDQIQAYMSSQAALHLEHKRKASFLA